MPGPTTDSHNALVGLGRLGALLLGVGYAVTDVIEALRGIATSADDPGLNVQVQPSMVLLDDPQTGTMRMALTESGLYTLRQTGEAANLVTKARTGRVELSDLSERVEAIIADSRKPPLPLALLGGALLSGAITVIFGSSWWVVVTSSLLGMVVAVLTSRLSNAAQSKGLLPFFAALAVSLAIVGVAALIGAKTVTLFALCGPLVLLVPGAAITNAVLEISGGDPVSGGGRLISGILVWAMLAAGVLVGIRATGARIESGALQMSSVTGVLGVDLGIWDQVPEKWVHWVAVALFGLGFAMLYSAPWVMTAGILVTVTIAYGILSIFTPLLGSIVAGGIAAGVTLFACQIFTRFTNNWPAIAIFRPAFQMMVPGSLGLVTALDVASGEGLGIGMRVFGAAIALTIGIQVGAACASGLIDRILPILERRMVAVKTLGKDSHG